MFKVFIRDLNQLYSFLRVNDTEYIDAFLDNGDTLFISNSPAMFGSLKLETDATPDTEPMQFRFPVKILRNMVTKGYLYVDKFDSDVKVAIYNSEDKKVAVVTFAMQNVFSESYVDKLQLLADSKGVTKCDASGLVKIARIGKTANSVVTLNKGIVGINLSNRGKLFLQPEDNNLKLYKFAIAAANLQFLLSIAHTVYIKENYIWVASDGLSVLATKCVGDANDEYALLEQSKACLRTEIDLANVVSFVRNMKIKITSLELHLDRQRCVFDDEHIHYEVPFTISDTVKSEKVDVSVIEVPWQVVNELFAGMEMKFILEKKKNFTKLTKNNMFIYF